MQIPIVNDVLDEQDETLSLTLTPVSGGAATGAFPEATLTILDDDAAPSFTSGAPPQAVTRAAYSHTFTATGSPAPTFSVTGGTLPTGLFLTSAGVLSGTPTTAGTYSNITVTASNGVSPAATQTFDLTVLSGGALQFSAGSYTVSENAGTATVTVNRVGGSAGATSVNFVITGNTASSGSDFSPASATLNFADGETSKSVDVTILNDDINERDEFANLFLNTVNGTATLGTPTVATLNITNDDPLPSIAVNDINVTEGDSGTKLATFTVTRTGLTDRSVTFSARTVDGTANSADDYVPVNSNFFQLGASATSTTVSVSIYGDTVIEPDKSFSLLLSSPANATISRAQGTAVIKDNDTTTGAPTVQLSAREFRASEGAGVVTVTVTRSGDSSAPTSVAYLTFNDGTATASDRRDYTPTFGYLRFAAGETSKTFNIFVADDAFVEGNETLQVGLGLPAGGGPLGVPTSATIRIIDNDTAPSQTNPVDDSTFFVRQHYRDFLNRDPDPSGLAFWTNEIEQCGSDLQCREVKRINVSAAFFLSIEFQEIGYLDYLLHKAAFNSGERLEARAFLLDTLVLGEGVVVGADNWPTKLEANRTAFIDGFVQRPEFLSLYPSTMTAAQFVDALNANTGDPLNPAAGGSLTQAERDALVAELTSGAKSRAQVLRAVAENREFKRRQLNKAFVLMQYFGYLRRGPNETPDTTFDGYNFWLGKLNDFQGNYISAEMVKAFISSAEYRQRFGQR
ncbi:MAG TPA: Calx-beta domain-containing protein [Pyrinomonadaceae bacterium]